jgi:hypothetical protein
MSSPENLQQEISCCKKTCDEVDLTGFGNLSGLKIRNAHIFVKMSSPENLQQEKFLL